MLGVAANSEDPYEKPHNAAFHQGLHCLLDKNDIQKNAIKFGNNNMGPLKLYIGSYMYQTRRAIPLGHNGLKAFK